MRNVSELLERVDIVEVVRHYLPALKKAGASFKAVCPFHSEKTPSFNVSPVKQLFYCFGCRKGGNAVNFIMLYENVAFNDACKRLADMFNLSFDRYTMTREEEERKRFITINSWAARLYNKALTSTANKALQYLRSRKVSDTTVDKLSLGYAGKSGLITLNFKKEGFQEGDLIELGLVKKLENGRLCDTFFNRLIIPIRNRGGDVIGFGGRALDEGQEPKYLNSRESALFRKNSVLFGIDLLDIRHGEMLYLCEGYFDVMLPFQAGLKQFVATMGTALTRNHCKTIKRYTNSVTLVFDSDSAGINSVRHSLPLLYDEELDIQICVLSSYKDPAEYIESGKADLLRLELSKTTGCIDFVMRSALNGRSFEQLSEREKITLVNELIGLGRQIHDPVKRELYINTLSGRLRVPSEVLKSSGRGDRVIVETTGRDALSAIDRIAIQLLAVCLCDPANLDGVIESAAARPALAIYMPWYKRVQEQSRQVNRSLANQFNEILGDIMNENEKDYLADFIMNVEDSLKTGEFINDCFKRVDLLERRNEMKEKLRLYKEAKDDAERNRYLKAIHDIKSGLISD